MNHNGKTHQVEHLYQSSQHLREKSMFTERHAVNSAAKIRAVSADLSALKVDEIFGQLRQMVALIGGRNA
jgi:uncharacterized protein (DUF3084 family)